MIFHKRGAVDRIDREILPQPDPSPRHLWGPWELQQFSVFAKQLPSFMEKFHGEINEKLDHRVCITKNNTFKYLFSTFKTFLESNYSRLRSFSIVNIFHFM